MRRVPETMRAAAIDRFGPPSVLRIRELPIPRVGARDVLIRIDTAGVGIWDAEMRAGWWPEGRPRFPLVLGSDGAGIVAAVGASVRRFRPGDRVQGYEFASSRSGFYAEYVSVPQSAVGGIPRGMSLREAGAMTVTGLTALQGVDEALRLRRGETVVIHGASGGVGTLAVQFALLRGARVIGTATGSAGRALVRRLGADAALDGRRRDLAGKIRRLAPGGADAVLAFAGANLAACLDALKDRGGRVAYPNGVEPEPRNRRGLRVTAYDAKADARRFAALKRASEAARLRVPIGAAYPLADAAKAHRRVEGHVIGKVVLRVR